MNNIINMKNLDFDVIVIGGGHAGVEASFASANLGNRTAMVVLDRRTISYMACNPSIGGTAKGHLVREIDALGGQMGINADKTMLQIKMLNRGKGAAVQSLRAQSDKDKYHETMEETLENLPNITIIEDEATEVLQDNGVVTHVITKNGLKLSAKAVVLACGVYLDSKIITGDEVHNQGPSGFASANSLTKSLLKLGFNIRRFKTGTPARVRKDSIDYSKFEPALGETDILPFSFMHDFYLENQMPCYLGYTNEKTHDIIRENLHRSPLFGGVIKGVGPRYCPSIEDKVVRFADRDRHQIFLEPETATSNEIYVQGMSSSLPKDVQEAMYHSIIGFENVEILKYAYAIEYDSIDPTDLYLTLQFKKVKGLYTAGQLNGSSGYEEAAAQGLLAGINASQYINNKEELILTRDSSYIGVLIDDLVTKGTNEPYRMMTARAEHRLNLRQDNADIRLTPIGKDIGLVSNERWDRLQASLIELELAKKQIKKGVSSPLINPFLVSIGQSPITDGSTFENILKRPGVTLVDLVKNFGILEEFSSLTIQRVETLIKYQGYLAKETLEIEKAKKLETRTLPADIDYLAIGGIRIEARQKLDKIRPSNLGQASRISGVSPADVTVLMLYLKR